MGEIVERMLLVARDSEDRPWLRAAACRGREQSCAFYPPMHHESRDERADREQRAKAICMSCPVQSACLEYALGIREPFGIWGGMTEYERKAMLTTAAVG
jgi:WhiB family redox-sensing transcriptional regulator